MKKLIAPLLTIVVLWAYLFSTQLSAQTKPKLQYEKQGRTDELKKEEAAESEEERSLIFKSSQSFEKTLKQPTPESAPKACEAQVALSYAQEDNRVRVEATISTNDCQTAKGAYRVLVKTKNAATDILQSAINSESHREEWTLRDGSSITQINYYEIPDNSELVKAQLQLRQREACWCETSN
jgi:hypothetical protein